MTTAAAILAIAINAAGHPTLSEDAARSFARVVDAEAARFEIDPLVLVALISRESDWKADAYNPKTGATGLMQVVASPEMLAGGFAQFEDQVQDPRVNVFLGTRRLRHFIDRCDGDVWHGIDGFDARGCKRKRLSPFALDVKARWLRLQAVVANEGGGR